MGTEIKTQEEQQLDAIGVKVCGPNVQGFWWYVQDFKGLYDVSETTYTTREIALRMAVTEYLTTLDVKVLP